MINKEEKTNEEKNHRRRGGAFDNFARVLRGIKKAIFGTGTVIEDRPGASIENVLNVAGYVKSKSVFEIYKNTKSKKDEYNLMYLGRKGTGYFRNTNYIEITADTKSNQSELKSANGKIILSLSKDGIHDGMSGIFIAGAKHYNLSDGIRIDLTVKEDAGGSGINLYYYNSNGSFSHGMVIDTDGIQMFGLPTSSPGGSGRIWKDTGVLKIT